MKIPSRLTADARFLVEKREPAAQAKRVNRVKTITLKFSDPEVTEILSALSVRRHSIWDQFNDPKRAKRSATDWMQEAATEIAGLWSYGVTDEYERLKELIEAILRRKVPR